MGEARISSRILMWSFVAVALCAAVPFVIHWYEGRNIFIRARDLGLPPHFYSVQAIVFGTFAPFLILFFCARMAKIRSYSLVPIVASISFLMGGLLLLTSAFVGRHLDEFFLDGFTQHCEARGVQTNSLPWAENIFERYAEPMDRSENVLLNDVPRFLQTLFDDSPSATLFYSKDSKRADFIEVQCGMAVARGIFVLKSDSVTNRLARLEGTRIRRCNDRVYTFIYRYK